MSVVALLLSSHLHEAQEHVLQGLLLGHVPRPQRTHPQRHGQAVRQGKPAVQPGVGQLPRPVVTLQAEAKRGKQQFAPRMHHRSLPDDLDHSSQTDHLIPIVYTSI